MALASTDDAADLLNSVDNIRKPINLKTSYRTIVFLIAAMLAKDLLRTLVAEHRAFVQVPSHGFVSLVDVLPRVVPEYVETGDHAIAAAARVSYMTDPTATAEKYDRAKDRKLIRRLMRDKHTSPFEMAELKFCVKAPIFVTRQWMRHRTGSFNEWSGRYSQLPTEFFMPDVARGQSKLNKQSSESRLGTGRGFNPEEQQLWLERSLEMRCRATHAYSAATESYHAMLAQNCGAREQARIVLPVGLYTQFVWKCSLHNLLHFLKLRMAPDAQLEIRLYANEIYKMVSLLFPDVCEAFDDYVLNTVTLSGPEVKDIKAGAADANALVLKKLEQF